MHSPVDLHHLLDVYVFSEPEVSCRRNKLLKVAADHVFVFHLHECFKMQNHELWMQDIASR